MRLTLTAIAAALILAAASASAPTDNTTREGRLRPRPGCFDAPAQEAPKPDTLTLIPGNIVPSGYDKTLRATREAMFLTNNTGIGISAVELTLTYHDLEGRELHSRTVWTDAVIPSGATRRVEIPAWDHQHTLYYYKGPAPRTPNVTPFRVTVTPLRAVGLLHP